MPVLCNAGETGALLLGDTATDVGPVGGEAAIALLDEEPVQTLEPTEVLRVVTLVRAVGHPGKHSFHSKVQIRKWKKFRCSIIVINTSSEAIN